MSEQALSGAVVIDLTHRIAGPYSTKFLADFGAEVIKIERPGEGDPARKAGPFLGEIPHPEKSGLFLYLNTNKEGITLNLKTEAGRAIFKKLVKKADVVVENFSPRVMPSWGLSYEVLAEINPKLVMTSISNFGQTGPYRDYKSADIVAYAMGSMMSLIGDPKREPLKSGGSQAQYQTGLNAAVGTLTALHGSRVMGVGQHVDVSILECVASMFGMTGYYYPYMGLIHKRRYNGYGLSHPTTNLPCKDGHVYVGMLFATRDEMALLTGNNQIAEDPRFDTPIGLLTYGDEMDAMIKEFLKDYTADEIVPLAQELRMAWGPVRTIDGLLKDPQLQLREFFVEIDHPATGPVTYPGPPFMLPESPWQAECPAPLLGQHNEEIYCGQLGYSRRELVRLRQMDVI
ncbi:MAG: CoA transferase [Chloroflexi bacterium]|nr:CoA transferase [Chloroflexota bacterium]